MTARDVLWIDAAGKVGVVGKVGGGGKELVGDDEFGSIMIVEFASLPLA
jgi:hypothetical protein